MKKCKKHDISNEELVNIFRYALDNKPEGITYVYNEPFLEDPKRREEVLKQLEQINSLCPGLIDTIGTQMHIEMTQNPEDIKKCFEDLNQTGLNIQITEFDMCLPERFMFGENGKVRSEQEIIELVNKKTGMKIGSMVELKEMRMNEMSKAIKETNISLEGITYWSISDTLDHNLERTNRKTFEQGLQRDIATTRYAGLYSDFNREMFRQESGKQVLEEIIATKNKTKKNKLLSFVSKIVNKIKNTVKRKDVEMLPEANQTIKNESGIKQNLKKIFLESIRVSSEELAENIEKQQTENVQIRQDKKDGPNLDD